jgi:hypothetical protein
MIVKLELMNVIQRSDNTTRRTKECQMIGTLLYSERNPSQCHFLHHKPHMDRPGMKRGPLQWGTATNCLSHALHASGRRRTIVSVRLIIQVRCLLSLDPWSKTNCRGIFLSLFPESLFGIAQPRSIRRLSDLTGGAPDTSWMRAVTISVYFQAVLLGSICISYRISLHISGALHTDLGKAFAFLAEVRFRQAKNHVTFSSSIMPCTSWLSGSRCVEADLHSSESETLLTIVFQLWTTKFQSMWGKVAGMWSRPLAFTCCSYSRVELYHPWSKM